MPEIRKPSIKDISKTAKISQRMTDFINKLKTDVLQFDIDGTETWRNKMITARNQRQGIKRVTNNPYPGAPDIPLPETDKLIRKHKPNFVLAAISGKKIMSITAQDGSDLVKNEVKEMIRKSELAMNFIFENKIPWVRRLTLATDRFLEKGFCIFKIIERFEARLISKRIDLEEFEGGILKELKKLPAAQKRAFISERFGLDPEIDSDKATIDDIMDQFNSGKTVIEFEVEEVDSFPDVLVPMPEKIFVPKGTTDIRTAIRVTHEFFLPEHILLKNALKGIYIKDKVLKMLGDGQDLKTGDQTLNEKLKDRLAGVTDNEEVGENFRIHETLAWYQPEDNKPFERWVFTFLADAAEEDQLIQYMPFPYEFEGWDYIRHDNEVMDENHYRSRGIPEQVRALQEFQERAVNNMLIRDEINNAPMFTVTSNSSIMSNNIKFVPGQKIRVSSHDEIKPLIEGRTVDVSSERIFKILKATGEEYIGSVDQLFRNATNKGADTLGELQEGIGQTQFLLSLDVMNWLDTLSKVYKIVFDIMKERLVNPIIVNGESITREDFQFEPRIKANGSVEMADKRLQAQKAFNRLKVVKEARSDGVATVDDVFNAYEDWLEKDGVQSPNDFITKPEEILNDQIAQLEQQAQKLNQLVADQNVVLEEGEKALDKTQDEVKENEAKSADLKRQNNKVKTEIENAKEEIARGGADSTAS